jgi:hypothetical protein
MTSVASAAVEVVTLTYPDELRPVCEVGDSLPYHRIAEVHLFGQSVKLSNAPEANLVERTLTLPVPLAVRLMDTASNMRDYGYHNCHRFSRSMKSAGLARGYEAQEPVTQYFRDRPRVDSLPAGAIGLIGVSGYGVPHSLVGIGEDIPESLQVMSSRGELGIAANEVVLGWYRQVHEGEDVYLYRAPET